MAKFICGKLGWTKDDLNEGMKILAQHVGVTVLAGAFIFELMLLG